MYTQTRTILRAGLEVKKGLGAATTTKEFKSRKNAPFRKRGTRRSRNGGGVHVVECAPMTTLKNLLFNY